MFSRTSIIIAIDDAGSAGRALDFGLDLAEQLRLPVRLVHVVPTGAILGSQVRRFDLDASDHSYDNAPECRLGALLLRRAMDRAGERRVQIEAVLLGGSPAHALMDYLDQCDRPILVMGRRGQGAVRELVLGSVSDSLVRHADCPVIVVT